MNPAKLTGIIRYYLAELGANNAHHEFEHMARHLARARIASNIVPATGPVSAGGDGGRDFETFDTEIPGVIAATPRFSDKTSGNRRIVFACSLESRIEAKVREDTQRIMDEIGADRVVFFCETNLPVAKRQKLQKWAKAQWGLQLDVFDGIAIAEWLTERDIFWIGQEYLHLPAEIMPDVSVDDGDWYSASVRRWLNRSPSPFSNADFNEIKFGLRHAVYHENARPDLNFWLRRMEEFLVAATPRPLYRSAVYELAVASLRGRNDMTTEIARLQDYFQDVDQWLSVADLESAATLVVYCFGAELQGMLRGELGQSFQWRQLVADCLEVQIAEAVGPGRRSGLLRVRGSLLVLPMEPGGDVPIEECFDSWSEMLDYAEKTPLFPIGDFADYFAKLAPSLGTHGRYDALTTRVDKLVAVRSGSAALGDKIFERAVAAYLRDDLTAAIRDFHRSQHNSFTGDSMVDYQRSSFLLAKCYLELGLAYAAKYASLGAAYSARYSDDPNVESTQTHLLFVAADAENAAGNSLTYLNSVFLATAVHVKLDADPLDSEKHPEPAGHLNQVAALRGFAKRWGQGHVELVDRALQLWPDELRVPIISGSEASTGSWQGDDWEEAWSDVQDSFIDRPFGDLGSRRTVRWRALGMSWSVEFDNLYGTTAIAEEFIVEMQIVIAAIAKLDLCLLPVGISLAVKIAHKAKRPRLKSLALDGDGGLAATVVLAGAAKPPEPGDGASHSLAILAAIIRACSVLPDEMLLRTLEPELKAAADRLHMVRPYREVYEEFMPEELFGIEGRQAHEPVASQEVFALRQHEILDATSGPGPGYSQEDSLSRIADRYATGIKCAGESLKRLLLDADKAAILADWHDEGLLDWEILSIVANAIINVRHPLGDTKSVGPNEIAAFRRAMETQERPENAIDPSLITDEILVACRHSFLAAMLNGLKLRAPLAANDVGSLEKLLVARFGLRSDDVVHLPIFPWATTQSIDRPMPPLP